MSDPDIDIVTVATADCEEVDDTESDARAEDEIGADGEPVLVVLLVPLGVNVPKEEIEGAMDAPLASADAEASDEDTALDVAVALVDNDPQPELVGVKVAVLDVVVDTVALVDADLDRGDADSEEDTVPETDAETVEVGDSVLETVDVEHTVNETDAVEELDRDGESVVEPEAVVVCASVVPLIDAANKHIQSR